MFPDSQLRIVEHTPLQLIAYDPPYYLFGVIFIAFGIFVFATMLFASSRTAEWKTAYNVGYVVAALFAVFGGLAMTAKSYVQVSRETQDLRVRKRMLGIPLDGDPIPLSEIREARVEQVKNLRRVVLVMRSGHVVYLTSATDREGHYDIADGINHFLGH